MSVRKRNKSFFASFFSKKEGLPFLTWIQAWAPGPKNTNHQERIRASTGALLGLLTTGFICTHAPASSLLIAPMGASAVLLFAVPASPLAQPWPVLGGNLVATLIGVTCARWIADPLLASAAATALAIFVMSNLRCLHPPAGGVALTAVLGGGAVKAAGYHFVFEPVMLNSLVLLGVAIVYNSLTGRAYPHPQRIRAASVHQTSDPTPLERLGIRREDLDTALAAYGQVLDVARDDLEGLFQSAELQAYNRRFGEITCREIMSLDVVSVTFGTPLDEAWLLLRRHDIRALPVVDPARRVVGMVCDLDFLVNAELDHYADLRSRFLRIIRRPLSTHLERPEVVGQIMRAQARTVRQTTHVVELVPLMAEEQLRHVAVVDDEGRLCGIVSQSDLIAALYRGRAGMG